MSSDDTNTGDSSTENTTSSTVENTIDSTAENTTGNTTENTIDLNLLELVSIAANSMEQLFIRANKEKAKATFKGLKNGKTEHLGKVKIAGVIEPTVSMSLDYSEFRGPGFNFDVFTQALTALLRQLAVKFNSKDDMNILPGENNSQLIHVPGIVKIADQFNVLVFAIELGQLQSINFKLMFIDPNQYPALAAEQSADSPST